MSNLQRIRTEKGLTQKQLAELSGVQKRMVEHYEQGTRSINGAAGITLYRIAEALDCDIKDLLEFDE